MAICAAVEARDLGCVSAFHLLLSAKLGRVAKFLAVSAKRNTSIDDLASVVEAFKELCPVLGPSLNLPGTISFLDKAVRNSVFLVDITLQIHVGEDLDEGSLSGNKPETDFLLDQRLLKLAIGDLAMNGLDVLIHSFFGIIDIPFSDCLLDFLPGNLGGHIGNMIAVDLAWLLTMLAKVA